MKFRRGYKKRVAGARSKIRVKKTAIGNSKTNIVKLNNQVRTIRRTLRKKAENVQYQYGATISDMVSDYCQVGLTQYASWTPIFGTSAVDGTDPKAYYKSLNIDCRLSIENFTNPSELDTLDYTVFLVSIRDEASNVWNATNGTLTLVAGRDYSNGGIGGVMIRLNPKMFKIHRMKRLTTSNFGAALQYSSAANFKPIYKWSWKVRPRHSIVNPIGDWNALTINRDPSKNYYVLCFNNNSSVDGTFPQLMVGSVSTIQVQGA